MNTRPLKLDLHMHSCDDPMDDIPHGHEALVDRLAECGFDGFAVTNHDSAKRSRLLEGYARERGLLLIPGMELEYKRQHIVLLNFADFDGIRSPWDIYTRKSPENLVLASHPFFPLAPSCGRLLLNFPRLFDAVEFSHLYNHFINFNRRAAETARRLGLPMVGTSDAHHLSQIGHTFTLARSEKEPDAVIQAIKEGRSEVVSSPFPFREFLSIVAKMKFIDAKRLAANARRLFGG